MAILEEFMTNFNSAFRLCLERSRLENGTETIYSNKLRRHLNILGDPGVDSGDEEKSKRAEKYMARRKVKNGEKSPWGQCLTRPVPNDRRRSGFWLVPENLRFSGNNQKPERRRPFGTGLVRHCPQGLFSPFFTFLRATYFSALLDFSSSPLSAPGSPRMASKMPKRNINMELNLDVTLPTAHPI